MPHNPYTANFYQTYLDESRGSARRVLPHVLERFRVRSVVDVGCGVGTWLSVFEELGVERLQGIDGAYVNPNQLLIDPRLFRSHDLTQPLTLDQPFDLATSLEVAEHLPAQYAQTFVDSLVSLAPLVLFSAAIPFQGGDHHVNEQWPEYWIELFAKRNYRCFDCIRPLVWDDNGVAYYYAQNTFVYVNAERVSSYPALAGLSPISKGVARVHPRRWLEANDPKRQHLKPVLQALPHSLTNAVGIRLKRSLGL